MMAEDDKDETVETPAPEAETPVAETPEPEAAEGPAPDAETPAAEAPAPDAETPAAEALAPDAETEAPEAPAPDAETEAPDAEAPVHPKVAHKRARSQHGGEARPPRSAQERQAERDATRKAKAAARRRGREKARAKHHERRGPTPEPTPPAERTPARQKLRQGVVISAKPDKTIAVRIDLTRRHPRYEKTVRTSTTLHAHDEANDANAGDTVRVVECRPLSRTKRWRLVEVLERAK